MSVKANTGASGGSNFDIQLLLRVLEENRQKDKREQEENRQKDKVEIVGALSEKLEKNQQTLEEMLEQNQQTRKKSQQELSQEIREEIKVQVAEINKVREECNKKYEQLEKRFLSKLVTEEEEEEEDELLRRQRERDAELEQPIQISETQAVEEITEEVAEEADKIAISMQEKDDAIVETDSQTSASPAGEVNDVTSASSEIATAIPNEMQLHPCIPLHKVTLASITLSDELRLYLLSSDVQLGGSSQQRDVCVRWNDSRFLLQIQQSPVLSSRGGMHVCDLSSGDQMQTVSCIISRVLTKATRSKTTDELGVQDKQLCAEIRTHQVAESVNEEREITAKKTTKWKKVKLQPENDAVRAIVISTSNNDFTVKG
jgi:hypothetical protein